MPLYKTNGIVLRTYPLGERDLIVVILSPDHGKIRCVAKGAKKQTSSLAGKVELTNHLSLLIVKGKNLDIISQVEVLEHFKEIRNNLDCLAHAIYILELIDKALPEPEPHPELYSLLYDTLYEMKNVSSLQLLLRVFELKLVSLLGYSPQTRHCVVCNLPREMVERFSFHLGGILCHRCFKKDPDAKSISPHGIDFIEKALQISIKESKNINISPGLLNTLTLIIQQYITSKIGHNLASKRFLEELALGCKK